MPSPDEAAKIIDAPGRTRRSGNGTKLLRRTQAAGARDLAIRAALERYVATLESLCREAPYNWFNFYDFWADADAPPAPAASP